MGIFGLILDIGKKQIIAHSNPDLRHHSVFGSSEKGFYLEILLNPLEEQFYLPSGFINLGNSGGREIKVVR